MEHQTREVPLYGKCILFTQQLEKQIIQKIEQDVTLRASQIGTNFRILDSSADPSSQSAESAKRKPKKNS